MKSAYRVLIFMITTLLVIVLIHSCKSPEQEDVPTLDMSSLQNDFLNPPGETRPGCYWYWINDNISKQGLTKDLEAMARVGIGRAYIGHIFNYTNDQNSTPKGSTKFMTDDWWEHVQWAVKEAERLGVEIGFFNSPGWSQSGGPWIKPEQSMRFINFSETLVQGGQKIDQIIPIPEITTYPNAGGSRPIQTGPKFTEKDFQDVKVIAFRQPEAESHDIDMNQIKVHSDQMNVSQLLFDNNQETFTTFPAGQHIVLELDLSEIPEKLLAIQSLSITPLDDSYVLRCLIERSDDRRSYEEIAVFSEERGHQGPKRKDAIFIPFTPIQSKFIRLTFQVNVPVRFSDLKLSRQARLGNYVRKQLAETSPSTSPSWNAYQWETQVEPAAGSSLISQEVIDLSDLMDSNGRLTWDAPEGDWAILRLGMIPIGTQNAPSSDESRGLEVDKMSREHVASLFDGMVGEFLRKTNPEDRKALKYIIADSYETGPQNWTDGFIEKFQTRFGYSPEPYLPVLTGRVVDNPEISDRFLWDMRRMIVEGIAYDYVGGLREICNQHDLTLWLENYGHWGYPSEFLLYGGQTNQVGGEFWVGGVRDNIECRAAVSSAHTYGKKSIYAEAFTSSHNFRQSPASLKKWCDWVFAVGINHLILHVNIHQPQENKPGIIQWFGTGFNRHNTWFEQSKGFIDYIRRCAVMLKAGMPVVDVAYYIGEHAPMMQGPNINSLPDGYHFDYINGDVLINRTTVKDGKICVENGPEYAVLVLPDNPEIRPEVIQAIQKLIQKGAIVLGSKPERSPSLSGYPECDQTVQKIANQIWGEGGAGNKKYGKGYIYCGTDLSEVLSEIIPGREVQISSQQDIRCAAAGSGKLGIDQNGGILFNHRKGKNRDIYFLANTTAEKVEFTASLRASGKAVSFWNAVTGSIEPVNECTIESGRTIIPMTLAPSESVFVVIDQCENQLNMEPKPAQSGEYQERLLVNLDHDWIVKFNGQGAPDQIHFDSLSDWTAHRDTMIRYYSGTAIYEKSFHLESLPEGHAVILRLENVHEVASVMLNGEEIGTLWCNPWEINLSQWLKKGENKLELAVTNTWHNRVLADSRLDKGDKLLQVSQPYNFGPNPQFLKSGLIGSASIIAKK